MSRYQMIQAIKDTAKIERYKVELSSFSPIARTLYSSGKTGVYFCGFLAPTASDQLTIRQPYRSPLDSWMVRQPNPIPAHLNNLGSRFGSCVSSMIQSPLNVAL